MQHIGLFIKIPIVVFILFSWNVEKTQAETYFFLDADGVAHFSDVPSDPRYRPHKQHASVKPIDRKMINRLIVSQARRHGVEVDLVRAVVKVESDFDPRAVSVAGAMGLMQLMPLTALDLGVDDPFDPAENLSGGVRLLSRLLDRYEGDITLAMAAYHAGPGRVDSHGGVPPIKQTHRYIAKILSAYQTYRMASSSPRMTYRVHSESGELIFTNVPENYRDSRRYRVSYEK